MNRKWSTSRLSEKGGLNADIIEDIMQEEKPNQKEKVSVPYGQVKKFIPESVPFEETGSYIVQALEFYQKYRHKVPTLSKNNDVR